MKDKFIDGEIIVNDDFSIIGVFIEECISVEMNEEVVWPMFRIAFVNGEFHENFDDMECKRWPNGYRKASDEETELFLASVEEETGKVWDYTKNNLVERDEKNWKIKDNIYPTTWSDAILNNEDANDFADSYLVCGKTNSMVERISVLGKLLVLRNIYMENYYIKAGETAYAIVKLPNDKLTVHPYIYGSRKSLLTFRFQAQAREFLTYFEGMINVALELEE